MEVCKYCGKEIDNEKAWNLDSEGNGYHVDCLIDKEFSEKGKCTIYIPNNATNGDVIKAVFPNAETWVEQFDTPVMRFDVPNNDTLECFNLIWWNALYERG